MTPTRPLIVGLTGGIGSGKSEVAAAFARHGAQVICTDAIARALVEPGQPALAEIARYFGPDVLTAEGQLDRRALRRRVFDTPEERHALEQILHPRIRTEVARRIDQAAGDYVIVDIPLLAESGSGYLAMLDRVLAVECPAPLRLQRVMRRDGSSEAQVRAMLAAQASDAERRAIADDVVQNHAGLDLLQAQVAVLDQRYRSIDPANREGLAGQARKGA